MPSPNSHLVLRSSTWHCRIDVPADLRPAFGNRRILSKSLRTGDKALAKELAALQIGQWKAEFRSLRNQRIRAGDQWKDELAAKAKAHHTNADATILRAVKGTFLPKDRPSPTPESVERGMEALTNNIRSLYAEIYRLEQELNLPGLLDEVDALFTDDALPLPAKLQRYSEIQQRVLAHGAKARNLLPEAGIAEALEIATAPETYRPKSPISASAQARFTSHLTEQNDNQRTRGVYLSSIKRFSTWLTTAGKELTFDTVAEYLDSVSKSRQTRLGHLAALRKFHKWAIRYDQYYRELFAEKRSPYDGHDHPKVGANGGESWTAYTKQEAEKLHATATANGDSDLADLIAFACYTGCRIEELGRIRQETTIFDDQSQPIGFRVDESKTESGIRDIPLHPNLVPIYTRRLQQPQGATQALFPGNDATKAGLRLNALSQRFTKLKRQAGFGDKHVFHSFRKCTATMLQQANVPPLVIPFLLGHDVGHISFDIYSAGPSFEQKREAITALNFEFENQHKPLISP
jgi:integrase